MEPPAGEPPASRASLQLVVVAGDTIRASPLPSSGSVTIGRAEGCDIRIDNPSVSRRHAVLHLGPPLRIEDLGSANGTFLREQRSPLETARTHRLQRLSKQTVEIGLGERVNLGTTTVLVRRAAPSPHDRPTSHKLPAVMPAGEGFIVQDPAMCALYEQARRAARSLLNVLILGETGVGKEVLARTLHANSPRAAGPYVEINCAALPPSLLEGELFGHEKNAFTGANQAKAGLLESADGGTVFLDEIGELPLAFQVTLLRVLEERKILRIGGRAPRRIDVRFVSATNRNLEAEIARGNFRQDLYFRLNGISFIIPPLRERTSEIALLAEKFLVDACGQIDRPSVPRISPEVSSALQRYSWPGNVRELRNIIERAVVLCDGDTLLPEDLPAHMTTASAAPLANRAAAAPKEQESARAGAVREEPRRSDPPPPEASDEMKRLRLEMKTVERQRIIDALEQSVGNQTRAARQLGISLRTLVNRLTEYDIPRPRRKP